MPLLAAGGGLVADEGWFRDVESPARTALPARRDGYNDASAVAPRAAGGENKLANAATNQSLNGFLADTERRAFKMALLATSNREDAMDIVQDAMFKLAQRYADKPAEEWAPLFYRILQSRINDYYRRKAVRNRVFTWLGRATDEDGDEQANALETMVADESSGPDGKVHDSRAAQRIEAELRQLPPRQRQAFLLRAWEGFDTAETASIMGCSEGSVKTHYSRAVHTMRERLGDDWL
ncbi:MAG: RNA polymerase sigma factor [Gammaproteobacteria bacterium]|nr:RNA polymerase sigma factor [Gammaproteobacteria bacterium]